MAKARKTKALSDWDAATRRCWVDERDQAGMTQAELAKRLKWTRDQVANAEAGRRRIAVADLIVFAEAIGRPAVEILGRILRW